MTISNPSVRNGPFTPDGAATAYPFNFLALSAGELQVTQVQAGVEVAISGWSAIVNGEGGTVLFTNPPGIGSGLIYINANPNLVQNLVGATALLPGSIAAALDRVTQIALLALSRSLTQGELTTSITSTVMSILSAENAIVADTGNGT